MQDNSKFSALIIGLAFFCGLGLLGHLVGTALIEFRQLERTVTVKGLSEHEYEADTVIWPIQFTAADNDLENLYATIEANTRKIQAFLEDKGITAEEITFGAPVIIDKSAQEYGSDTGAAFRYIANQLVTVYSHNVTTVRPVMSSLSELGRQGIVFSGNYHENRIEYIFSRLNEVKPRMIEEATREARAVAQKFAADSQSSLGKIKKARQGQFSISDRDKSNPQIKKVRVVSTIEYYLSD